MSRTVLMDCSYSCSAFLPATTKCADQDFCFHLPSAMSILSYNDQKRSASQQYSCMNFTNSQVHIITDAAKGFLPLLDLNETISFSDTLPEYIAATVSSSELHKAVSHCFKYADHLTLEYKASNITVSGRLHRGGCTSILIPCISSDSDGDSDSSHYWRLQFQGKMLLWVAKAFNKYYAKSHIYLEMRKDFPLIFKVDDGDFCSKVMLAPYTQVEPNYSSDDDVDPEPI